MNKHVELSRRDLLAAGAAMGAGILAGPAVTARAAAAPAASAEPFGFCLNTATLRGQKLGLAEEVDVVAKAAYGAIEPWVGEITKYRDTGGSLKDLAKRVADAGLAVPSAIGFPAWIVDDDAKRAAGLEQAKRDLDLVAQIGGKRMAAPAVGESDQAAGDLLKVAQRYRAFCEIGQTAGVAPELEIWGHSKAMNRVGKALLIAIESGHPLACILPDVFHLYKGGGELGALRLAAPAIHVFHFNDYPADPPRERIGDDRRVWPGDGIAPLGAILRELRAGGAKCFLSIEVFNKEYWKTDALTTAKAGLEKLRGVVVKA